MPYLEAMLELDTTDPDTMYYNDSAENIALYFLANASTFRGSDAKKLKEELKKLINYGKYSKKSK